MHQQPPHAPFAPKRRSRSGQSSGVSSLVVIAPLIRRGSIKLAVRGARRGPRSAYPASCVDSSFARRSNTRCSALPAASAGRRRAWRGGTSVALRPARDAMAKLLTRKTNAIAGGSIVLAPIAFGLFVVAASAPDRSPFLTREGVRPPQPVP